jgi:hypothetical protein
MCVVTNNHNLGKSTVNRFNCKPSSQVGRLRSRIACARAIRNFSRFLESQRTDVRNWLKPRRLTGRGPFSGESYS